MKLTGRVWRFGDDVNTDLIAPGIYMKSPLEELAAHHVGGHLKVAPEHASPKVLKLMKIFDAIYESAEKGASVKIT